MVKVDKKKRKDKYEINIYGIEVHVLINYTDADIKNEYVTFDSEPLTDDFTNSVNSKGMECGILRDKETKNKVCIININTAKAVNMTDLIGTAGHESFHAAATIAEYIELKLDRCSEEAYAYLTGYITECVYKTLFKL